MTCALSEFANAVVSVSMVRVFSRIRASVAPRVLHFSAFIISAQVILDGLKTVQTILKPSGPFGSCLAAFKPVGRL